MAVSNARDKHHPGRPDDVRLQQLNERVAASAELDGVDVRVYLLLCRVLNFNEPVHVPQTQIADILGRQKTHISRSLRKLVSMGILVVGEGGTRAAEWMLNPDFGT